MLGERSRCLVYGGAVVLALSCARVHAQPIERVPSPTYGVVVFGRLEQAIIDSIRRRDADKLGALVAPNFMLHVNTISGPMEQRSDWLTQSMREAAFDSRMERLTVREVGNEISIASFVWIINPPETPPMPISIVDVWQKSGDNWLLRVRYATPMIDNVHVPGASR
jgi:hypothetical protein